MTPGICDATCIDVRDLGPVFVVTVTGKDFLGPKNDGTAGPRRFALPIASFGLET